MKKLFLSIMAIASIATVSNAQMTIRYGPELDLTESTQVWTSSNSAVTTFPSVGIGTGVRVGGIVDFGFTEHISLQPGIMYAMTQYTLSDFFGAANPFPKSTNGIYIPINLQYNFTVGSGKIFVGLTPYISYLFSGKNGDGTSTKFGSDSTAQSKALDYGIGINAGYELANGLLFRLGYDYGLANVFPTSDATVHNLAYHIGAAWLFGGSR